VALPTIADSSEDAELRQLWAEYLKTLDALEMAKAAHKPMRAAYDAEWASIKYNALSGDGKFGKLHDMLWKKHGVEPSWRAVNRQWTKIRKIVKAVRKAKAEGLVGVGIKLSVLEATQSRMTLP
jgi:hypothetical protein